MAIQAKRYSIEDIIADEVAKQVGKQVSSTPVDGGLGSLGIKDIGDITKLLKEVKELSGIMGGQQAQPKVIRGSVLTEGSSVNKERGPMPASVPTLQPATEAQEDGKTAISVDIPALVDRFIAFMPLFIQQYGDLKLSEVQPLLQKERESIVSALEAMVS